MLPPHIETESHESEYRTKPPQKMSSNSSPSHYAEDAFVTDADFKVEINQKMKVPEKISFNDRNGDIRNSWVRDNFNMQVPERILVAGQDQHVGKN